MAEAEQYLLETEAALLVAEYGIPYPAHGLARDAEEASRIAEGLGFPVALKVASPDVIHKSDAGGVLVGLQDAAGVRRGFETVVDRLGRAVPNARIEGVLVCDQAPDGLEVIVGALQDRTFGPSVMFGMGGVFAEVLRDVSFRVAPLRRRDAEEMITEIRGYPLLGGLRGRAPLDVGALVELLLAVSQLAIEHNEIHELDLNPVRVYEEGLLALDARMLVKADSDGEGL